MQRNTMSGLIALATAIATSATAETRAPSLLDWYWEQAPRAYDQRAFDTVYQDPHVQVRAFRVDGPVATVPHTENPAPGNGGNPPPCVSPGLPSDYEEYADALVVSGGAVMSSAWAGQTFSPLVFIAGAVLSGIGRLMTYDQRSDANCGAALLYLPGHYSAEEVNTLWRIRASYWDSADAGAEEIVPGQDKAWAQAGPLSFSQTTLPAPPTGTYVQEFGRRVNNLEIQRIGEADCPVTLVALPLKNWSHKRDRRVRLEAEIDKALLAPGSCIDLSLVNDQIYEETITHAFNGETIAAYLDAVRYWLSPPQASPH